MHCSNIEFSFYRIRILCVKGCGEFGPAACLVEMKWGKKINAPAGNLKIAEKFGLSR